MNAGSRFMVFFAISVLIIIADAVALILLPMPIWLFIAVLAAAIVLCFVPLVGFKGAQASIEGDALRLSAPFVNLVIPLSSIDAVELCRDFDPGLRVYGYGGIKSGSGTFTNSRFGTYTFAGTTAIPCFVIVRYDGKKMVAFNAVDEGTTAGIYSRIAEATEADGPVCTPAMSEKGAASHRTMHRIMVGGIVLCIVVVFAVVALSLTAGHVDVSMDDDGVSIDATMMHRDIAYGDIVLAELRDDVDYGARVGGYGGMDISSGNFRNDEFGRYQLAVHHDVRWCIVLHLSGGDVVVFNLSSDGATEAFHGDLVDRLASAALQEPMCSGSIYADAVAHL